MHPFLQFLQICLRRVYFVSDTGFIDSDAVFSYQSNERIMSEALIQERCSDYNIPIYSMMLVGLVFQQQERLKI